MASQPAERTDTRAAADGGVDERTLVARIRAGDANAFDTLVAGYYEGLYRVAYRYIGSREMAEELVQDVLFRVAELGTEWNPTGSVGAYLATATRRAAINAIRRIRLEARWAVDAAQSPDLTGLATEPATPDDDLQAAELRVALVRAVAALPPRCREAFTLHRERGLSYLEVAHVMGISRATVKIQVGRALKMLRYSLRAFLPDPEGADGDL